MNVDDLVYWKNIHTGFMFSTIYVIVHVKEAVEGRTMYHLVKFNDGLVEARGYTYGTMGNDNQWILVKVE